MNCPNCLFEDSKVIDSRPWDDGNAIRRRRECPNCGHRFSTIERVEGLVAKVIKKDSTVQEFDKDKLLSGLKTACSKRPVTKGQMLAICNEVEKLILKQRNQEMDSKTIGEIVMKRLKTIDKVSYVRFASVYKDFTAPDAFAEWVEGMAKEI